MNTYLHRFTRHFKGRMQPVLLLVIIIAVISFVTRFALMMKAGESFDWSVLNVLLSFLIGLVYDLAMSSFFVLPFVLLLWFQNERSYLGKWKWLTAGVYLALLSLMLFTNIFPEDF
ncbi:MAG TPA: hypothetical protein VF145_02945, partial [Chitinophagaceae bacterium]